MYYGVKLPTSNSIIVSRSLSLTLSRSLSVLLKILFLTPPPPQRTRYPFCQLPIELFVSAIRTPVAATAARQSNWQPQSLSSPSGSHSPSAVQAQWKYVFISSFCCLVIYYYNYYDSVGTAARPRARRPRVCGSIPGRGEKYFLFPTISRPTLNPTNIKLKSRNFFSMRIKRPGV